MMGRMDTPPPIRPMRANTPVPESDRPSRPSHPQTLPPPLPSPVPPPPWSEGPAPDEGAPEGPQPPLRTPLPPGPEEVPTGTPAPSPDTTGKGLAVQNIHLQPTPDIWGSRFKTFRDGLVYALVAWIAYKLRMVDKLDPGTGVLLLLVAGIRPNHIVDAVIAARGGAGRNAMMFAPMLWGIPVDRFRSFFGT